MSRYKITYGELVIAGKTYPVSKLEMFNNDLGFRLKAEATVPATFVTNTPRAGESEEQTLARSVEGRKELKRRELYAFAKTGAPPALVAEGNVSDASPRCICNTERREQCEYSEHCAKEAEGIALVENVIHRLDPFEIEIALRDREAAFEDSILPRGATVLPPRELYAATMRPERAVPRMQDQKPWSATFENCTCRERMGNDFFFLPPGICISRNPCDTKPAPVRPESLNDFTKQVHADNAHWWHDPATGEKLNRNMGEMLMLVVSEIAECMEGERKDLMDDHLPHRKMAEVELADAIIRIADIIGSVKFAFESHYDVVRLEREALPENKGEALLWVIKPLMAIRFYEGQALYRKLARFFWRVELYAARYGYDLWGAVAEKRKYNKHRADHKPAARLAPNGKKF